MPSVDGVSLPFIPAGGIEELRQPRQQPGLKTAEDPFGKIFEEELKKLKFSAHAKSRIVSRELDISPGEFARLESAVDRAGEKGGTESLVLLDDRAFIVNIPNRTVITAMGAEQMKENVFTNIDSAVFA